MYVEESDSPDDPYLAVLDDAGEPWGVFSREIVWIAPVPSAEAVQAAVDALKANNEYLRDACIPDEETDVLTAVNNKAIAGLTGGEG